MMISRRGSRGFQIRRRRAASAISDGSIFVGGTWNPCSAAAAVASNHCARTTGDLVAIPNLDRERALHARFKTLRRRLRKHSGLSETAHWNLREMR